MKKIFVVIIGLMIDGCAQDVKNGHCIVIDSIREGYLSHNGYCIYNSIYDPRDYIDLCNKFNMGDTIRIKLEKK